jgi:hypothetical protein
VPKVEETVTPFEEGSVEMLRQWASPEPGDVPHRRFRTTAIFDGEPDLGTRAKTIVRDAWTGREASSR